MNASRLYALGLALIVIGFAVLFLAGTGSSSSSFGGVIFIGPVPIVFGTGPSAGILALIALMAAVGMILVVYLSWFGRPRKKGDSA
jgi:uncharacterized membrane protein